MHSPRPFTPYPGPKAVPPKVTVIYSPRDGEHPLEAIMCEWPDGDVTEVYRWVGEPTPPKLQQRPRGYFNIALLARRHEMRAELRRNLPTFAENEEQKAEWRASLGNPESATRERMAARVEADRWDKFWLRFDRIEAADAHIQAWIDRLACRLLGPIGDPETAEAEQAEANAKSLMQRCECPQCTRDGLE